MLNYIALGVSAGILLLSVVAVLTESVSYNTKTGRVLRKMRITLRELSFAALIVTAVVLMIIAAVSGDSNKKLMWADIGILAVSWLILHFRRLVRTNRSKRHAHKKTPLFTVERTTLNERFAPLASEAKLAAELPEAKKAAELKAADVK